eukprot:6627488-Ditylum_brightwellii.AAC.1
MTMKLTKKVSGIIDTGTVIQRKDKRQTEAAQEERTDATRCFLFMIDCAQWSWQRRGLVLVSWSQGSS